MDVTIVKNILVYLPYFEDIINVLFVNKIFYLAAKDLLKDFDIRSMILNHGIIDKRKKYMCSEYQLKYACMRGDLECIRRVIELGVAWYEDGLFGACLNGNMTVINFIIKHHIKNYDAGLAGACQGGHLDVAKYMISKGAKNFLFAMDEACKAGNLEIVTYLMEKVDKISNYEFCCACMGGNMDIVKLLVEKVDDRKMGFGFAARRGFLDIVIFLIERGDIDKKTIIRELCTRQNPLPDDVAEYLGNVSNFYK